MVAAIVEQERLIARFRLPDFDKSPSGLDIFRDAGRFGHLKTICLKSVDMETDRFANLFFYESHGLARCNATGEIRHVSRVITPPPSQ